MYDKQFYMFTNTCRVTFVNSFPCTFVSQKTKYNVVIIPAVDAFFHKFSIAPNGKTTDRIKEVRGCKNGTDLLHHHAKLGGDCGSRAGCR